MSIEKIQRKTLRQEVYEQIRETIITGELFPGEPISLRTLAKKFDVSQMPVREALWQLEAEDIIVIDSNKSMRVNNLTFKEFEEITSLRITLETLLCEKACDLQSSEDIADLERIIAEMNNAVNEPRRYLHTNKQLHFRIYEISDMPVHIHIVDGLWARVGPYFNIELLGVEQFRVVSYGDHLKMYEALMKKDKSKMKKALENDIQTAAERIRRFLINPELIKACMKSYLEKRPSI